MTTSQNDPSMQSRTADVEETGGSTAGGAMGASAKEQLSFADRHRAPTTKDVETNRWTGAAPGTLKKGAGGLHGGGVVPDGWTPEDGVVGGNTSGTGMGGSGMGNTDTLDREGGGHSLRREEEMGMAGAGVGAGTGEMREGYGDGVGRSEMRREENMGMAGAGTGVGSGEMREGYGDGVGRSEMRREEGYGYDNTTGTGTGMGTTGGAMGTTGEMGNTGLTGSSGTAPGADGYEHAHTPGYGLRGAELRRGDFVADQSSHGQNFGESGVTGTKNEPVHGENMGEHDNEATGKTKKNPLTKIVDAVKNI